MRDVGSNDTHGLQHQSLFLSRILLHMTWRRTLLDGRNKEDYYGTTKKQYETITHKRHTTRLPAARAREWMEAPAPPPIRFPTGRLSSRGASKGRTCLVVVSRP